MTDSRRDPDAGPGDPTRGTGAVRPAHAGDAAGIAACVRAAYQHYVERIGKPPGPMLDDYDAVVREHEAFVVERDARIVGAIVLVRGDGGILLDNVAVHPDAQGSGLGRVLVDFAESHAARAGFEHVDLYTHALMHENLTWYARRGYVETRRVREHGFDRVYMRKALDRAR